MICAMLRHACGDVDPWRLTLEGRCVVCDEVLSGRGWLVNQKHNSPSIHDALLTRLIREQPTQYGVLDEVLISMRHLGSSLRSVHYYTTVHAQHQINATTLAPRLTRPSSICPRPRLHRESLSVHL